MMAGFIGTLILIANSSFGGHSVGRFLTRVQCHVSLGAGALKYFKMAHQLPRLQHRKLVNSNAQC